MSLYSLSLILLFLIVAWGTFKNGFFHTFGSFVSIWLLMQIGSPLIFSLFENDSSKEIFPVSLAVVSYVILMLFFRLLPNASGLFIECRLTSYRNVFYTHWMMVVGLCLKIAAILFNSNFSILYYLNNQHEYDTTLRTVGFLDIGLDVFIFAAGVHAIYCINNSSRRKLFVIAICIIISMVSSSKAPILAFVTVMYFLYKTAPIKIDLQVGYAQLLVFSFCAIIISGVKTQIKYLGLSGVTLSIDDWLMNFVGLLNVRLGSNGIFEMYENVVNRVDSDPSLLLNGKAILGVFTSIMPGFMFSSLDQKSHPFRAIGYLTNNDFHVDPDANYPVSFFGFMYIDYGLTGYLFLLIICLIIFIFLTKFLIKIPGPSGRLAYLFFMLNFLPRFSESGFLNMLYWFIMSLFIPLLIFFRRLLVLQKSHTIFHD